MHFMQQHDKRRAVFETQERVQFLCSTPKKPSPCIQQGRPTDLHFPPQPLPLFLAFGTYPPNSSVSPPIIQELVSTHPPAPAHPPPSASPLSPPPPRPPSPPTPPAARPAPSRTGCRTTRRPARRAGLHSPGGTGCRTSRPSSTQCNIHKNKRKGYLVACEQRPALLLVLFAHDAELRRVQLVWMARQLCALLGGPHEEQRRVLPRRDAAWPVER